MFLEAVQNPESAALLRVLPPAGSVRRDPTVETMETPRADHGRRGRSSLDPGFADRTTEPFLFEPVRTRMQRSSSRRGRRLGRRAATGVAP
ncbi:hypothetical protein C493_02151 [Natronolimnohabitans innermongolicus JCM 12255]|uniref:Uncharacterized protein n=1 Tax=Natronolimnohabitans innermongolicus JCM 12255 TaxID=1227499 RepID=L9XLU2_9EURY|nr:hypothetical protein C493_02151 [Natronolimnohabitans innermongolicus JCM 12255]